MVSILVSVNSVPSVVKMALLHHRGHREHRGHAPIANGSALRALNLKLRHGPPDSSPPVPLPHEYAQAKTESESESAEPLDSGLCELCALCGENGTPSPQRTPGAQRACQIGCAIPDLAGSRAALCSPPSTTCLFSGHFVVLRPKLQRRLFDDCLRECHQAILRRPQDRGRRQRLATRRSNCILWS